MDNKNILLYIPTEGQETIIFLSVTSPAYFLKYSPEIMRSYFFPMLSRKNANIKSVKLPVTVTSTLQIFTFISITGMFGCMFCVVQAFEIKWLV